MKKFARNFSFKSKHTLQDYFCLIQVDSSFAKLSDLFAVCRCFKILR